MEVQAAGLPKIFLWKKKRICLSLATMLFLSNFIAEHMFLPFILVCSDTKPVKIAGQGS